MLETIVCSPSHLTEPNYLLMFTVTQIFTIQFKFGNDAVLQAHKLGLYGSDYAWLLQGLPADGWWDDVRPCGTDLRSAAESVILVTNYKPQTGRAASISGLVSVYSLKFHRRR